MPTTVCPRPGHWRKKLIYSPKGRFGKCGWKFGIYPLSLESLLFCSRDKKLYDHKACIGSFVHSLINNSG